MNCQFPYKRSILCQCLKINWNNICCYHINLIYNVRVFLLLLLFFCVYYCNVMSMCSGQEVSFLFFVWADFYCLCCYYGLPALLSQWLFGSLSYLTNKMLACLNAKMQFIGLLIGKLDNISGHMKISRRNAITMLTLTAEP